MALFVISYDLHKQRTYPPVWGLLESWGAVRLLESLWLLNTGASAAQVRDDLMRVVDSDDSIAVIELKHGAYWAGLRMKEAGLGWLRKNLLE